MNTGSHRISTLLVSNDKGLSNQRSDTQAGAKPTSIALVYNTAQYLLNMRGDLIQLLVERDVAVWAIAPKDSAVPALENMGVKVLDWRLSGHGMNPVAEWMSYRRLKRLLADAQVDMVFSFTLKPVIYASLAARRLGIRRVYSMVPGRGYLFGDATLLQRVLRFVVSPIYRRSLRCNRRVFFQNAEDRAYFMDRCFVTREQAALVDGSGVDTRRFVPQPKRTVTGTFLLVARLLKEKGISEYVAAARALRAKYPQTRFQILGPFSQSPSGVKPNSVRRWHAEGVIEYLGETDDVRPFLARCMVYVLPSYYGEGVPRSSLEALAMGKPVVSTDWAGCRETVVDGTNGYLVPIRSPAALERALERFIQNPGLAEDMGRASRRLAESRFDVRRINESLLRALFA